MVNKRIKWLFFGGGLLAGIAIGIAFASMLGSEQVAPETSLASNPPVEKKTKPVLVKAEEVKERAIPKKEKPPKKEEEVTAFQPPLADSGALDSIVPPIDSTLMAAATDSLPPLDSIPQKRLNDSAFREPGVIIVKQDMLISALSVQLINLDTDTSSTSPNRKDSLLSALSGMKEKSLKNAYEIELWQSPINYKGYKMANNKIVLFGMEADTPISLYQLNTQLYLHNQQSVFRIDPTFAFKSYDRIENDSIINQLKTE